MGDRTRVMGDEGASGVGGDGDRVRRRSPVESNQSTCGHSNQKKRQKKEVASDVGGSRRTVLLGSIGVEGGTVTFLAAGGEGSGGDSSGVGGVGGVGVGGDVSFAALNGGVGGDGGGAEVSTVSTMRKGRKVVLEAEVSPVSPVSKRMNTGRKIMETRVESRIRMLEAAVKPNLMTSTPTLMTVRASFPK